MRRYSSGLTMILLAVATLVMPGLSGAAEKEKKKPYPHYWMSIATISQSMPGMPTEMPGIGALFGGKSPFGPRRELTLQLESPRVIGEAPMAAHEIPPDQKMGESLPLLTPEKDKSDRSPTRQTQPEKYEKPKVRMLIYWGCGENIGKGQPKVIDTAKMSMSEFGKAFAGRSPTHQTPPSPRKGWTYGDWPNSDKKTEIPSDSSLVGSHLIKGNYTIDIPFSLDKKRDFMAPVEFSSISSLPNGATKVEWKEIPTAIGYFATAMGHNQSSGETIFWSASEVQETGFALLDYLTPTDVNKYIKEKVVLPPTRTSCIVPPVFKDAQGAMLQFIGYGEELNLVHPPKPKDPKQPWNIEWSVKARLKSTGMTTLMAMDDDSGKKATRKTRKKVQPKEEDAADSSGQENESRGEKSKEGIQDRIKGLFGF